MVVPGFPKVASFALAFAAAAAPAAALADDAIDLEWRAPTACPDGGAARSAIERYVGQLGQRALSLSGPVVVQVVLEPGPGDDWIGRVELRSDAGQGSRVFRGPTCDEVAEAATLIIAIMLDPLKTTAHVREAESEAAKAPPEVPPADVPPRRPSDADVAIEVGLQTTADANTLPEPTVGVGLVVGFRVGPWLFQGEATDWFAQRILRGPTAGSGGELGLYTGAVRGCFDVVQSRKGRLSFGPCAHLEMGVATGQGVGLDQPASSNAFWGAAFGGATLRLVSSPLAAWLSAEVGSPFARPEYAIDGYGTIFHASPVLLRAASGVAWTFP